MTSPAGPPTAPSSGSVAARAVPFGTIYRLVLRQIVTRARMSGLGVLAGLLVFIGWAAGRADPSLRDAVSLIGNMGLAVLLPIGALVLAGASLGDLREDRTMVYLWLRPMPVWLVPTAAVAASVTTLLPLTVAAGAVAAMLLGVDGSLVTGTVTAMIAGSFAYSAVFVAFGLLVKRTLLWGLVYILIWEGFVAGGGQGAARFAIRAYTRSIVADITDVDVDLAAFSVSTSLTVAVLVTIGATALAVVRYARMDVD